MARRTAGAPIPMRPAGPVIDVRRHREGLRDAADEVRTLVDRMTRGMAILQGMTADDPDRPEGENLWRELVVRLHTSLRSAYARWALLKIALPYDEAISIWNAEMPTETAMQAIGIDDLLRYWRARIDRPEWVTHEESALITKNYWPPRYGMDRLNSGIADFYEPPPF